MSCVIPVIPLPRKWSLQEGTGPKRGPLHVHPSATNYLPLTVIAKELGLKLKADPSLDGNAARIGAGEMPAAPSQPEGYALTITPGHAAVNASDLRGLVWGLGTLAQLAGAGSPCCTVEDWPTYQIRYHHDDVSRKQVSTLDDFRQIIKRLARFKFSHYTPYLEDMLLVDGVPQMGQGRGALNADAVRAIVKEGEMHQVEVFPTLSLAGHQENLLKLPAYHALGARTWQPRSSYDPSNPAVRVHLQKIIDAACPLFSSKYFHMCFDEMQGLDAEAFLAHANWCAERLVEKGKIPLMWADMLYNHFGCDLLKRLHPAIIPVPWHYNPTGGKAQDYLAEMLQYRPNAWALAGYNNWCNFVHTPLADLHRQWELWRSVADPSRVSGIGASQWGDEGFENQRDFCWASFAAFGEQAWSGVDSDPTTVEERFQRSFHGHPLPELTELRRLMESGWSISPSAAWKLHRLPPSGWLRRIKRGDLPKPALLAADSKRLEAARKLLARCRRLAVRSVEHLDHYEVAIDRMASVNLRALAAWKGSAASVRAAVRALEIARASYRRVWLAHNRPENIEVSLSVFDKQIAAWSAFGKKAGPIPSHFHPLDLGKQWTTNNPSVEGLPIGLEVIDGVPLRFAGENRTHAELEPGKSITLRLPGVPLEDMHLVATSPRDGTVPLPALRVRLLRKGELLYEEDLLSIRHLCDWWAPLGEHIWAGGGFAYVDPMRVRYVLCPGSFHGITAVYRFPWPGAPEPDRIELSAIGTRPVQIFAITLVEAER